MSTGGDYGIVRHSFWTDPEIKRALTPEQKTLLLYWFTGPHSNLIGLYHCPLTYASFETGLDIETARSWTLGSLSRWVTYDEKTEEIFVHGAAGQRLGDDPKPNDNRMKTVRRILAAIHSALLMERFREKYAHWPLGEKPEAPSKGLARGSEAPSKGGLQVQEAPHDIAVNKAKQVNQPPPPPSAGASDRDRTATDRLRALLGDRSAVIDQLAESTGSTSWASDLWGWYRPPGANGEGDGGGTQLTDLAGLTPDEMVEALAIAMGDYASDGAEYRRRVFRGFMRTAVDEIRGRKEGAGAKRRRGASRQKDPPEQQEYTPTTKFEGLKR